MAPEPQDQETREVGALAPQPVDDNAPTPRRGTPIARLRGRITRATRGLSRKHWNGARLVVIVLLGVAIALLLFMFVKQLG
jgi:hypothetical protein